MKRIRLYFSVLIVTVAVAGCDAAAMTGANNPNPPACNPEFPTMGSGC